MSNYNGEFNKLLLTDCHSSKVKCFSETQVSIRHLTPSWWGLFGNIAEPLGTKAMQNNRSLGDGSQALQISAQAACFLISEM